VQRKKEEAKFEDGTVGHEAKKGGRGQGQGRSCCREADGWISGGRGVKI